jgi:hypothetical protein
MTDPPAEKGNGISVLEIISGCTEKIQALFKKINRDESIGGTI